MPICHDMDGRRLHSVYGDEISEHYRLASESRRVKGKVVAMKADERKAFDAGFEAGMKSVRESGKRKRVMASSPKKRPMKKKAVAGVEYRIFIGAVSEPTLGEWVDLPCDEETIDEVIEKIQSAGFEEYFIPDYEGVYGYSAQEMEFKDPYELNELVSDLESYSDADSLPEEVYIALVEEYGLAEVPNVVDGVWYVEGDTYSDLAYNYVAEFGDLAEAVGTDDLERYFDYEAYGRDLAYDFNIHANGYFIRTGSQKKMCVCVKGKPIGCKAARKASNTADVAGAKKASAADFIVIPRVPNFNEFSHYKGNIPEVGAIDMASVSELYLLLDDYHEFALLVSYDTEAEAWQWFVCGTSPNYMGEGLWDTRSFGYDSPEEAYSQMKRAIERCDTAYIVA